MNIANVLSYSRFVIIAISWIFAYTGNKLIVGILLLLSGLTDVLDGFLARRLGIESEYGAKLDTLADSIVTVSLVVFVFLLLPEVYSENKVFVLISVVLILIATFIGYIVHKRNVALHLYSMKFLSVVGYLFFAHSLIFGYNVGFLYFVGVVTILASLEEILVVLFRNPEINTKSIFFK